MGRPENPELVERIMTIVITLLETSGHNEISMRTIAKEAGVTPTTIYYYFKNKDELFEKIKITIFKQLDDYLLSCSESCSSAGDQLEAYIYGLFTWFKENRHLAEAVFDKLLPQTDIDEELQNHYYISFNRVRDIFNRGIKNRELCSSRVDVDISVIFTWIYGLSKINIDFLPEGVRSKEVLLKRGIELFLQEITQ